MYFIEAPSYVIYMTEARPKALEILQFVRHSKDLNKAQHKTY